MIDQQGASLTHAELSQAAAAFSTTLAARGLKRGDLIGAFLPNRVGWLVAVLGASHLGVGVLGLNTRFRKAELDHLLGVAEIDAVIAPSDFLGLDCWALFSELERSVEVWDEPDVGARTQTERSAPSGQLSDPLIGFTTSGTTGFPKIAMHDQSQVVVHHLNAIEAFGYTAEAVVLIGVPLCGTFGFSTAAATILAGGTAVLHETWDVHAVAVAIAEHGVTRMKATDDMLIGVLETGKVTPTTTWTEGWTADFTNNAVLARDLASQATGGRLVLSGIYGSSEGFAMMSHFAGAPDDERIQAGGVLAGDGMDVRAVDPDTGATLAANVPGELHFRGPNLITGYLNNPDADATAFTADGWYRSGDLGFTLERSPDVRPAFVFLSRMGDSLRLRGFLCDPAEIEKHLERHPAVDLAQVVGARGEDGADRAVAFVRLVEGPAAFTALREDLHVHCREGLANYKRPEHIEFVDEFPVTEGPNGMKIRKVELRERAEGIIAR